MPQHTPRSTAVPVPARRPAYAGQARDYDRLTSAFAGFRRTIVQALPLSAGEAVLDVGCGTGLCFPMLQDKIGRNGRIVGVEASPQMLAVARERVARHGWRNVTLIQAPIAEAPIPFAADAALLCAVHDVLRSPPALRKVIESLRPGARVAAGGGKWASPFMVALNVQVQALHSPYVHSFEGFDRPWSHLAPLLKEIHVREMAMGAGYVATGRVS